METPLRTRLSVVTTGALALALLGGCASESDTPDTTSPASTETAAPDSPSGTAPAPGPTGSASAAPTDGSEGDDGAAGDDEAAEAEAQALAVGYLEAIAAGDDEAAFALLSPESQDWYTDASGFSSTRLQDGSLTPEAASDVLTGAVRTTAGPEGGFFVVTVSAGSFADSFVVRTEDTGMVVDDPGVPTTGPSAWEWQNPAVGPDDDRQQARYAGSSAPTIRFTTVVDASGTVLAEPPTSALGAVDGTEVPVVLRADEDERLATVGEQLAARGQTVTIAWQPDPESAMWRTSTVTLMP